MSYYHERFPFILDDLCQLELQTPAVLEGAAFLPDLIVRCPVRSSHVIYMVPTMEFQLHHYQQRQWIQGILKECRDPQQAFDHWMKRDVLFGEEVIHLAKASGFHVILVDGSVDIQTQFKAIEKQFRAGDH